MSLRLCPVAASIALVVLFAASSSGQTPVTITEAMARARTRAPAARVIAAATREAEARVTEARAALLPRVDVTSTIQRGDQPVFVFGSLLAQRRFTAANFELATLNEPPATTNVRTALSVDQPVFDARSRLGSRAAALDRDLARVAQTDGSQDLALQAAQAFVRVLQLESMVQATGAAVAAAASDLERVRARRDAGLVTDADVLAVEVHLADVREREIVVNGDLQVARIALNDAIGVPLEEPLALVRPAPPTDTGDPATVATNALMDRPERQLADLHVQQARNGRDLARAAFLPRVSVQGGWEFNGSTWTTQRPAWMLGGQVQFNVFTGFADVARLAAAREAEMRALAEREQTTSRIAVEVQTALSRVDTARARVTSGRAALAQAREAQRIIRDRYAAGLATVTDVLRAAEAALDAEARASSADMDLILQGVALDHARGRL